MQGDTIIVAATEAKTPMEATPDVENQILRANPANTAIGHLQGRRVTPLDRTLKCLDRGLICAGEALNCLSCPIKFLVAVSIIYIASVVFSAPFITLLPEDRRILSNYFIWGPSLAAIICACGLYSIVGLIKWNPDDC